MAWPIEASDRTWVSTVGTGTAGVGVVTDSWRGNWSSVPTSQTPMRQHRWSCVSLRNLWCGSPFQHGARRGI